MTDRDFSQIETAQLRETAHRLAREDNFDEALSRLHELRRRNSTTVGDYFDFARVYLKQEDVERCHDTCDVLISFLLRQSSQTYQGNLDSDISEAYMYKGLNYGHVDDYVRGMDCYRKVVHYSPMMSRGWNNLGFTLVRQRRWAEAIEPLERSRDLDRTDPLPYVNLGHAHHGLQNWSDALTNYDEAIQLGEPYDGASGWVFRGTSELLARTYMRRSMCYAHLNRIDDAYHDVTASFRHDPSFRRLELFLGDLDHGATDLQECLPQMPTSEATLLLKGRVDDFLAESRFNDERSDVELFLLLERLCLKDVVRVAEGTAATELNVGSYLIHD